MVQIAVAAKTHAPSPYASLSQECDFGPHGHEMALSTRHWVHVPSRKKREGKRQAPTSWPWLKACVTHATKKR